MGNLKLKSFIFVFTFLLSFESWGLTEVSGSYGYSRRVYGSERQNQIVSNNTGASLAIYLLNFLALEFNYNESTQNQEEFPNITSTGSTLTLKKYKNTIIGESWGMGVRFSLAPKKALLRPDVSLGYAKQTVTDSSEYTFFDSSDSSTINVAGKTTRYKNDSLFASFALNFRLTERLKLTAGIKTIFPAFEWNEAKDYLKYSLGFSWVL